MPDKPIDEVQDEYIAAINRRTTIDNEVKLYLATHQTLSRETAAEWRRLMEADRQAEADIRNAREAYQRAMFVGERFSEL